MGQATRRRSATTAALLAAVIALVACGTQVVTGKPTMEPGPAKLAPPTPAGVDAFTIAVRGDCLTWPEQRPDLSSIADCSEPHRFEVSEVVDLTGPYGPNSAPPTADEIQQLSVEHCEPAARRYLGTKYDPNGRFTVGLAWRGERSWRATDEQRDLCGLQLAGPDGHQPMFVGRVADLDQSKVWPAGTCLGIDAARQPTDVPADCATPHAMEVTGTVDVGAGFPGGLPAEPIQDAFIKEACVRATDAYLAPIALRATTLTVVYGPIERASWDAGSRQVACRIGAVTDTGWATLLNSAKGALLIDGQPPAP